MILKSKKIHSKKLAINGVDKPSRSQWCHYVPFFQRRPIQESISGGDGIERKIKREPFWNYHDLALFHATSPSMKQHGSGDPINS